MKNNKLLIKKIIFFHLLFGLIILMTTDSTLAQKKLINNKYDWERIIPLLTKKSEVEKFFGKPILENGYVSAYKSEQGKILVWYNGAKDFEEPRCKWDVSPDTVRNYDISLFEGIPISMIKFDLSLFKRELNHTGQIIYSNTERGISFVAYLTKDGKEIVSLIYYTPSFSDKKDKCIPVK